MDAVHSSQMSVTIYLQMHYNIMEDLYDNHENNFRIHPHVETILVFLIMWDESKGLYSFIAT